MLLSQNSHVAFVVRDRGNPFLNILSRDLQSGNPCQSCPSLTTLVPLWFIIISLVFSYLYEVLFSGFLQFKGNFVDGQIKELKIP